MILWFYNSMTVRGPGRQAGVACTTLSPEINDTERSTGSKTLPELLFTAEFSAAAELRLGAGCGGASEFLGRCPVPISDASVQHRAPSWCWQLGAATPTLLR